MRNCTNNYGEEQFYSFYTIDMPIHQKQLDQVRDELQDHFDNRASEFERWVWDTCEGVDNDGWGSFRFEWPAEVMNFLTEQQRQDMEDIINDACNYVDIICNMNYLHSYNAGEQEMETTSDVEDYIDTIIGAGYSLCKDDADTVPDHLQDAFNSYFALVKIKEVA